MVQCCWT